MNYEDIRFEDHSNDPDPRKMLTEHRRDGKQPISHLARKKLMRPHPKPAPIATN